MIKSFTDFIEKNKRVIFYLIIAIQILFLAGMSVERVLPLVFGRRIMLEIVPVDPNDFFRGEYVRLRYPISNVVSDVECETGDTVRILLGKRNDGWEAVRVLGVDDKAPPSTDGSIMIKGTIDHVDDKRTYILDDFTYLGSDGWMRKNDRLIEATRTIRENPNDEIPRLNVNEIVYIAFTGTHGSDGVWNTWYKDIDNDLAGLRSRYGDSDVAYVSARVSSARIEFEYEISYGIESWFVPQGTAFEYERADVARRLRAEIAVDGAGTAVFSRMFLDGRQLDFNARSHDR